MTIEVEGPDGAVHEFPDGTSTAVIQTAMANHYGKPKRTAADMATPKVAEQRDVFSPFADTVRAAGHRVAENYREDEARARAAAGKPTTVKSLAADALNAVTHPFEAGGALRAPKEAMDMFSAATSPIAGAVNIVSDPVEKATRFGGEKGISIADALSVMGPEVGGVNKLAELSKLAEGAKVEEAIAGAAKPRVRVKAGSSAGPETAPPAVPEAAPKPRVRVEAGSSTKNTLADAQKAWAKSSKDPKHAERAAKLMEDGVELTLGQRAGGMAKRIEEANKSNPYVGQAIRDNEQRALTSFNRVAARKSLEAAGLPADFPPVAEGRDFVKVAHDRFSKAYDANAEKYKLTGDETLRDALQGVHASLRELPADKRLQFESIIDRRVFDRMGIKLSKDEGFAEALDQISGKSLNGQTFKEVESELTYLSGKYHSAPDPADNLFAEHLDEALGALRDNMERSSDPSVRAQLKKLNTGYAMFTRVRGAAQNRATAGGRFTTGDFLGAVKRLDRSKAKGAFARGDALFQDFAEDAHAVLANVMADSGTAERTNITRPGMIGAGAGGMVGSMLGGPLGAAAGIGVEAAARPTVNALADRLLQQRTESLMSGEATKAPGNINNYLRAAQMRAGGYSVPRMLFQPALAANRPQEPQQ